MPNFPVPTSFNLTKDFYIDKKKIALKILDILDIKLKIDKNLTFGTIEPLDYNSGIVNM